MTSISAASAALRARLALSALVVAGSALPASGEIVETSTISNSYFYELGGTFTDTAESGSGATTDPFGGTLGVARSVMVDGQVSEMNLAMQGTLDGNGNFYFLSSGTCVGYCRAVMTTTVDFTVTNTGTAPVDVRFDSLITPGHLARMNVGPGTGDSLAFYDFSVSQDGVPLHASEGFTVRPVASADLFLVRGPVPFNDINEAEGPNWAVRDWGATPLNIVLGTLAPGASTNVRYSSVVTLGSLQGGCTDTLTCLGFQVAFGDPRNNGSISNRAAMSAHFQPSPAVGALYDPYAARFAFVDARTPLPPPPPSLGVLSYDTAYVPIGVSAAVPEPTVWAMLAIGFGALGGAMRRGHRRFARAAPA